MDFPFSPVRLMVLMLPQDASLVELEMVRTHAGLAYLISLMSHADLCGSGADA